MIFLVKSLVNAVKIKWFIIGLSIYSIILGLMIYGFIEPNKRIYSENMKDQEGINDMYINLVSLDIESVLDSINTQIEYFENFESIFRNKLIKASDFNAIIPILDQYCKESHLIVESLSPTQKVELINKKLIKRFVRVQVCGKYLDYLQLLKKMEYYSKWLLLEKLTIYKNDDNKNNQFDMVISVVQLND